MTRNDTTITLDVAAQRWTCDIPDAYAVRSPNLDTMDLKCSPIVCSSNGGYEKSAGKRCDRRSLFTWPGP